MERTLPAFVRAAPGGAAIRVHAVPRAARSEIAGMQGDALRIRVKAPPVDGKANAALCEFVAAALGLPKRAVRVASGESAREKTLLATGADPAAAAALLAPDGGTTT